MTRAEFIEEVAAVLSVDAKELRLDVDLTSFETWDSTAVLNLMVLLDEQGLEVDQDKVPDCRSVQDILDLVGDQLR
ncbi:MAG: acyl carrier protein [Myxococcales bacterium]|nr:acyl carrier protein [Myxococcales bacterium]